MAWLAVVSALMGCAQGNYRCVLADKSVYLGTSPVDNAQCVRLLARPEPAPQESSTEAATDSGPASMQPPATVPASASPATAKAPADSPRAAATAPATAGQPVAPTRTDPGPFPAVGRPPFINEAANALENRHIPALRTFVHKWSNAQAQPIRIAHFGDSHLQSGYTAEVIRQRLQAVRGRGGRGMVFPYALARTYSQNDYTSTFSGLWATASSMQLSPRLPLGVSGFTARSKETTGSFQVRFHAPLDPGPKRLRLFLQTSVPRVLVIASSGAQQASQVLQSQAAAGTPTLDFSLPRLDDQIRVDFVNLSGEPGTFDLHGISIENLGNGLIHDNLGVGGATFSALNQQALFDQQAKALNPDVFILDWGTNDIIYRNAVPTDHRTTVSRTIRRIRAKFPHALIILMSVQDMSYRSRKVSAAQDYAQLMRRIAEEEGCLYWDWFRVAGGPDSMRQWLAAGLAQPDQLHLSVRGYRLRGALMAEALLRAFGPVSPDPP